MSFVEVKVIVKVILETSGFLCFVYGIIDISIICWLNTCVVNTDKSYSLVGNCLSLLKILVATLMCFVKSMGARSCKICGVCFLGSALRFDNLGKKRQRLKTLEVSQLRKRNKDFQRRSEE